MWGILRIEAEDLAEAKRIAIEEAGLPCDGHYIEDSFEIDEESDILGEIEEER